MNRKEYPRFADYLLDEIGQIEDRYIAEAQAPYRAAGEMTVLRRALIVVLSLALLLTALLAVLLIGSLRGAKTEDAELDAEAPQETTIRNQSVTSSTATLSSRLDSLRADTEHLQASKDDIDLFDGQAKIIWKYCDEETYRVQPLSASEHEQLTQALHTTEQTIAPAGAQALEGIWIAEGDGTVLSPCLEQSPGTVGYGTIFSYSPETEPSTAFTDTLCGILS